MDAPLMPPPTRPWRRFVLLGFALVLLLFTKSEPVSWADASRLGTIQALVEHQSLSLDETAYLWQGDKVFIGGHYYSHQPPMMALVGSLPYGLLHSFGRAIDDPGTYKFLTLCLVGLPMLLGLGALGRMARKLGAPEHTSAILMFAAAFGTLALPYSLVLNQHGLAAALVLLGLEAVTRRRLLAAGALFAFASTVDLTASFFALAMAIPLAWSHDGQRNRLRLAPLGAYALGALPLLALHFAVNIAITGDGLPTGLHSEAFEYPLSPFAFMRLTGDRGGLTGSSLKYAQMALFGESGLFSLCPLLLLALILGIKSWRQQPQARPLFAAILLGSLGTALFYITASRNFGGSAFGMRWFTVFAPALLLLPAPALARGSGPRLLGWPLLLFAWSAAFAGLGAVQPWAKFHWRFEDSPMGMVAGAHEEHPNRAEFLGAEWQRITRLKGIYTEDQMDALYQRLIDQHRRWYLRDQPKVDGQLRSAWLTTGMTKLHHAVELLDQAQSQANSRAIGHFWLGKFQLALGRPKLAAQEFELTLELRPSYPWAQQALEDLNRPTPSATK